MDLDIYGAYKHKLDATAAVKKELLARLGKSLEK